VVMSQVFHSSEDCDLETERDNRKEEIKKKEGLRNSLNWPRFEPLYFRNTIPDRYGYTNLFSQVNEMSTFKIKTGLHVQLGITGNIC